MVVLINTDVEARLEAGSPGCCLASEAIEGAALALEGVDHVQGRDGLAASVLGVCHRITDDVLEEDLEHTPGLLVDEARDALDATTASQAADSRLGDALDVVTKNLAVALGTALAESFTALATSRHCIEGEGYEYEDNTKINKSWL